MTQSGYFYNLAQFYQFNFYNIVYIYPLIMS